jgi:hypothetical protein
LPEIKPLFGYDKKIENIKRNKRKNIIKKLENLRKSLIKEINIPKRLIEIDKQFLRINAHPAIAKFSGKIKEKKAYLALLTELPSYDRPILRLEWL